VEWRNVTICLKDENRSLGGTEKKLVNYSENQVKWTRKVIGKKNQNISQSQEKTDKKVV